MNVSRRRLVALAARWGVVATAGPAAVTRLVQAGQSTAPKVTEIVSKFIPFGGTPAYADGLAMTIRAGRVLGLTNRSGRFVQWGDRVLEPEQTLHFAEGIAEQAVLGMSAVVR